jgi:heat shock protein HslJ
MKKVIFLFVMAFALVMSCKSTPKFSDVIGKDWKLIEVRINDVDIRFNRNTLVNEGFGEIFTLKFDSGIISGVGAPNRYSAPFTQRDKQGLSIMLMRSTLMASIREPERLREHDFFIYMQNVYEWNLIDDILELTSKNDDGETVVLIFSL